MIPPRDLCRAMVCLLRSGYLDPLLTSGPMLLRNSSTTVNTIMEMRLDSGQMESFLPSPQSSSIFPQFLCSQVSKRDCNKHRNRQGNRRGNQPLSSPCETMFIFGSSYVTMVVPTRRSPHQWLASPKLPAFHLISKHLPCTK